MTVAARAEASGRGTIRLHRLVGATGQVPFGLGGSAITLQIDWKIAELEDYLGAHGSCPSYQND